jgi:hypothetical protein
MTHLALIAAETDDAYYEHERLQRLKAEAAELAARVEVIEFRHTPAAIDQPLAA